MDYGFVRQMLHQLREQVLIQVVAFDPWNASSLATELMGEGFSMIQTSQGYQTLSEPTKRFLALVSAGQLQHPRHPCLTWMASNFAVRRDANDNIAPDKGKASDRIDGCTALIMALGRAMLAPAAAPMSDFQGLMVVWGRRHDAGRAALHRARWTQWRAQEPAATSARSALNPPALARPFDPLAVARDSDRPAATG